MPPPNTTEDTETMSIEDDWRYRSAAWENLKPGDAVTFKHGDREFTDTVTSVGYSSPEPALWPQLSWWQRMVRRATPRRWRKPVQPTRAYKPATYTVSTHRDADAVKRGLETITAMQTTMDELGLPRGV